MGVYIDMKMPEGCALCKIKRRSGKKMVCSLCDEEWDIHDSMSADHRLDNCPLRPVPQHGRLIDADALEKDVDKYIGGEETRSRFHHWVQVQRTVIPESEEART
jgi:hypothetical protein